MYESARKYPWYEMEVGDSFFIEATEKAEIAKIRGRLHNTVRNLRRCGKLNQDYRVSVHRVRDETVIIWVCAAGV